MKQLRTNYGDMVRLDGLISRRSCVFLYNTELIECMYGKSGSLPTRILVPSINRYYEENLVNENQYSFFARQGEHWYRGRTRVNPHLLKPDTIMTYLTLMDDICNDFLNELSKIRDPISFNLPEKDFMNYLNKWALENSFYAALKQRLGLFEPNLSPNSDGMRMMDALSGISKLIYELDMKPSLAKYSKVYKTRNVKLFYKKLEVISEISNVHMTKVLEQVKTRPSDVNPGIFERLLVEGEEIAKMVTVDALIAGVDVINNVIGKVLYLIATHPEVQKKLQIELDVALLQIDSPFTEDTVKKIPYLKACIKETIRCYPVSFGVLRTMNEDVILAGYKIPKGMDLVAAHSVLASDEKQFPDPDKFNPERWLRDSDTTVCPKRIDHPYAFLPFGHGPRACVGKRLSYAYMEVILSKIFRRFHLEWSGTESLQTDDHLVNEIITPLELTFHDRKSLYCISK